MSLFQRRGPGIGTAILCGVGGLLVGAGVVAALTPVKGTELRKLVVDLLNTKLHSKMGEEPIDQQLDRMEGEGGVSHEVNPPLTGESYRSHS